MYVKVELVRKMATCNRLIRQKLLATTNEPHLPTDLLALLSPSLVPLKRNDNIFLAATKNKKEGMTVKTFNGIRRNFLEPDIKWSWPTLPLTSARLLLQTDL